MARMLTRIFLVLLLLVATVQVAFAEKRVALVIGNSNYVLAPLKNPKNDAEDVSASLLRLRFDVTERRNVTISDFDRALGDFVVQAKNADVALFFFSGHGLQIDKRGYLAPIDIKAESESSALRELVSIQEVVSRLENVAKISVIVLDACRDSPLQERLRRIAIEKDKALVPPRGLPPISVIGSNTLVVYATVPGETASDGIGRNSPFTASFLRHVETPGLEIEQMFKRVTADVVKYTRGKQQPERLSRLQNELVLLPGRSDGLDKMRKRLAELEAAIAQANRKKPTESEPLPVQPNPLEISGQSDRVVVALDGPMTGSFAMFGAQFKVGAEAAVADINAAGGLLGKKIELEIGDDACDPRQARSLADSTASLKPAVVVGHFCSGVSIPASKVYAEQKLIQISPASSNPKLTDERAGPGVFRICGRDDQQGGVAGAYIAKIYKDKNVAILHDKTTYGKGLAYETKKALNAAGKKEVLYEAITAGEKDYTIIVAKLKRAKADIVFLGGYHTEAGLIVREMRVQGLKTILMGGDALVTKEYWDITGADGEGTLMTFIPDPHKKPSSTDLVRKFRRRNIEPEGWVLYTYATLQVWEQAVKKAKSFDFAKVVKVMNGMEFDTAIGTFTFDEKGDPDLPPYGIYKWSGGNYEQISGR